MSINLGLVILSLIAAIGIMFVSVSRVSIQMTKEEEDMDKLRKTEVDFMIVNADSTTEPSSYKFPESRTTAANPFYGFKQVRDSLWMSLSQGNLNKCKTALLISDKKMVEADILWRDGNWLKALETSKDAIDKLKYADSLVSPALDDQQKQVQWEIIKAGYAYREMMEKGRDTFGLDVDRYQKLINEIENWNESQRNKKEILGL